jgi:hypothetical protein
LRKGNRQEQGGGPIGKTLSPWQRVASFGASQDWRGEVKNDPLAKSHPPRNSILETVFEFSTQTA